MGAVLAWKVWSWKKKTKALQVGQLLRATPRLSIGNQVISHVTVHKHLGVLLRQDLKWSNHIHEVISKATRKVGLLRFVIHNLYDSLTILWSYSSIMYDLLWSMPVHYGMVPYRKTMPWRWNKSKQLLPDKSCELLGTHRSLTSLRNLTGLPFDGEEKSPASAFCTSCWITALNPFLPFSSRLSHGVLLTPKESLATDSWSSTHNTVLSFILFRTSVVWNTLPSSIQTQTDARIFKSKIIEHFSSE